MGAMGPEERDGHDLPLSREGTFDAQLSFPAPFVEAPPPIATIVKRDGREVPFEKRKIADAIFQAARSIGGQDRARAESLATGVTIYLMKYLKGRTPTVDQVHDAVEKVLIEMGHARTALAYARYRDRRARMRQLRAGNIRALLKELAEAEGEVPPPPPAPDDALFVRTSGEAVVNWDGDRIVQALVRETELDESVAHVIARDVERQIRAANVRTLTAALVRELVDAKLIELGLEEHRRRHARLGVPLYDAERILCTPNGDLGSVPRDPEASNGILAEQVKREYALSRVFSQGVADAHLRGDLHIHHLGAIDRLHSIAPSLDAVKLFGAGTGAAAPRPPRTAEALVGQMVQATAALRNHCCFAISWEAVNVYFAPFVQGQSPDAQRSLARTLLFLLSHLNPVPGRALPTVELELTYDVPYPLNRAEAIGPGGRPTGRTYGDYALAAQDFARALLEVHRKSRESVEASPVPAPVVRLTHEFFRTPGHDEFLDGAARAAAEGWLEFALDRSVLPERGRGRLWQPVRLAGQEVSVNLPRLAYEAEDEETLMAALEGILETAVRAHREKQAFLQKLFALGGVGPLRLLGQVYDGQPFVEPERAACLVSPVGLNECVRALTGSGLHESEDALSLGLRIVERLKVLCDRRSEREGLAFLPVQAEDRQAVRRLAELDLLESPGAARAVLGADTADREPQYTPGVSVAASAASPMDRLRIEGRLHDWIEVMVPVPLALPDSETSPASIAHFLTQAFFKTSCTRLALGPDLEP